MNLQISPLEGDTLPHAILPLPLLLAPLSYSLSRPPSLLSVSRHPSQPPGPQSEIYWGVSLFCNHRAPYPLREHAFCRILPSPIARLVVKRRETNASPNFWTLRQAMSSSLWVEEGRLKRGGSSFQGDGGLSPAVHNYHVSMKAAAHTTQIRF